HTVGTAHRNESPLGLAPGRSQRRGGSSLGECTGEPITFGYPDAVQSLHDHRFFSFNPSARVTRWKCSRACSSVRDESSACHDLASCRHMSTSRQSLIS